MFCKFELGHNIVEATKKICHVKVEGTVDLSTVTRGFKKFCLSCKHLKGLAWSESPKTMDF